MTLLFEDGIYGQMLIITGPRHPAPCHCERSEAISGNGLVTTLLKITTFFFDHRNFDTRILDLFRLPAAGRDFEIKISNFSPFLDPASQLTGLCDPGH